MSVSDELPKPKVVLIGDSLLDNYGPLPWNFRPKSNLAIPENQAITALLDKLFTEYNESNHKQLYGSTLNLAAAG